ncbi:MAG: 2TM domain-containing protein, partial [Candidatus Dadabacteria bacterium]
LTDHQIHEIARKRVGFRAHLVVYLVTNAAFWIIWLATGQGYLWPVWLMALWGIGLVFHYMFDYRTTSFLSEEEEYKKLKSHLEEHNVFKV